ncbi:solute carrier family 23 member 1-like isoform X3 [Octopus vulgaris]|uniref:Solute carrier family 23 member 1-like isoform X3 n=1 Tax=Octopus vulgaris TaxID=6645 RepID=A0AA36AH58_OCTVU|nr:solute carrier family 23 member 1-like isoform X3 [Octopus vulgaris]
MENNTSTRRKSSNKFDSKEVDYEEDPKLGYNLVYGVLDNPPIYVSLSLAVQNILTLLAGAMGFAAVLADLVCVDVTDPLRAQLFSTTVILSGVATVAQTSLGTRTAACASLFILYLNGVTLKFPPWSKKPKEIAIFRNYPVASRIVLNIAGVLLIIMAILGKVAASLATIPDPVVGAINFTGLTMMLSVGLTNLQKTALNARNTLIIGTSLGLSWVSSSWLYTYPNDINTGNFELDQILKIVLGTQTFVGPLVAIFLDNTIPGTLTERGMQHLLPETDTTEPPNYHTGEIVYEFPRIQNFLNKHQSVFGKLAILPPKKVIEVDEETEKLKDEIDQTDSV